MPGPPAFSDRFADPTAPSATPENRRAWRGFAHAVGEDPTHGLLGHMRRAFSFTELELEGVEGLMQDAPAAVR